MWPELVDAYLRRLDATVPGLVEGFYLVVGSLALDDYRPGRLAFLDLALRPG